MTTLEKIESSIEDIGLTRYEAKIYLSLLEYGTSTAGEISKKLGLHRRTVYDLIDRLVEKGIVSYITEHGVRKYSPADPKILLEIADKKKKEIMQVMPQLELLYKSSEQEEVSLFKGKSGIKSIFEQQLADEKTVYVISGPQLASNFLTFFIDFYTNRRIEKKIRLKIIYFGGEKENIPLAEVRVLPKQYVSSAAINIWGDKVAIILWQDKPFAILIKSQAISDSYMKHFRLLWDAAK